MRTILIPIVASLALPAAASAQELRIGFLNTTTGGGAIIGRDTENGWKLGLAHQGWTTDGDKLGGVVTRIFYADDQQKTEAGLKEVERMMKNDRVQIVAGILWSNVLMTIARPVTDQKILLLSTNAGPSPLAGSLCNPLFVSTSWVNDDFHEALGELMQREGIKTVVAMVPNYQAGKDGIASFSHFYEGKVIETILYKFGERDFQADLSRVRAAKPEAVYLFAPGAMGIAFMKQWGASGLAKDIKLYSVATIGYETLPAIGDAAIGSQIATNWTDDIPNPVNERFVKEYVAKFERMPSNFAAQAYDAPGLIAAGVKAVGGKLDDIPALARAMRTRPLQSVRGNLKYEFNGFPIQPFYKAVATKDAGGKLVLKSAGVISERSNTVRQECPADRRILAN